jgi:hypothetical protein
LRCACEQTRPETQQDYTKDSVKRRGTSTSKSKHVYGTSTSTSSISLRCIITALHPGLFRWRRQRPSHTTTPPLSEARTCTYEKYFSPAVEQSPLDCGLRTNKFVRESPSGPTERVRKSPGLRWFQLVVVFQLAMRRRRWGDRQADEQTKRERDRKRGREGGRERRQRQVLVTMEHDKIVQNRTVPAPTRLHVGAPETYAYGQINTDPQTTKPRAAV